jgi:hypothetical protein
VREFPRTVFNSTFGESTNDKAGSTNPRQLYEVLEPWSREVGVKLAAKSDFAALALTVGGEIGDTYWYMRSEGHYGQPRDWIRHNSWHQLLNEKRMEHVTLRLKLLSDFLPTPVVDCLSYSLSRWGIAHAIEYRGNQLIMVKGDKKDVAQDREKGGILKQIRKSDEQRLVDHLRRQSAIWRELILGFRSPESHLSRKQRRIVLRSAILLYVLIVFGASIGIAFAGYALIGFMGGVLSRALTLVSDYLMPSDAHQWTLTTGIDTVAVVLPIATSAFVFIATVIRDGWSRSKGLWNRLHVYLLQRQIAAGTYVSWNSQAAE